jgi:uncharacterized protein
MMCISDLRIASRMLEPKPLRAYRAPWWLPGGHLQTLYGALVAAKPSVRFRRERWETPDQDFIDLDWVDGARDAPLVALFHGLEGSSSSHYARSLMATVQAFSWRGVVPHFRGCGGELNRAPRAYHSGDSAELDWILRRLKPIAGEAPLFAAGVSLGGNVLLKWCGEHGAQAREVIAAAATVSAPMDLRAAGDHLARGFNMAYTWNFLRTLKRRSIAQLERYPALFDKQRLLRSRTMREFDDVVTAPLHGFADTDDYWTRSSSKLLLRHIAVPTLIVHARNDPFMPATALATQHEVSSAVRLLYTDTGGHAGFVSPPFPGRLDWLGQTLLGFFEKMKAEG